MASKLSLKFIKGSDTLEINDNTKFRIESIEGIDTSELELYTTSNATYDGMTLLSKGLTQRPISISIDYTGQEKERKRQEIIKFFNLKSQGTLIVTYGDIERAIDYHIENFSCPLKNIHYKLSFTVDLICLNPYFREVINKKVDIATWLGEFVFPLIIPQEEGIILGLRQPSVIINIFNEGDIETGVIIKIKALGSTSKPKIINAQTGEYMLINKDMVQGDEIEINTNKGEKKVTFISGGIETNILNLLDIGSTFLTLATGDNLLTYDAEENVDNLEISIYYNPYYMGI